MGTLSDECEPRMIGNTALKRSAAYAWRGSAIWDACAREQGEESRTKGGGKAGVSVRATSNASNEISFPIFGTPKKRR